jgi:hypothetical protein
MTTPVSFNTPDRLIKYAYDDAGIVGDGQDPSSEQMAKGLNKMNDLINYLQTQGLKLWLNFDLPIPLTSGQATYILGPGGSVNMTKPMRVISSYYLDSSGNQRPLTVLSWDDWTRLSNKQQLGQINSYFVDKQQLSLNVSFWLTPDDLAANLGEAHCLIQQQVAQMVGTMDGVSFPIEWFSAIRWGLALELASKQPDGIKQTCAQMYQLYLKNLEDWDVEDAPTFLQPDMRGGYISNFR